LLRNSKFNDPKIEGVSLSYSCGKQGNKHPQTPASRRLFTGGSSSDVFKATLQLPVVAAGLREEDKYDFDRSISDQNQGLSGSIAKPNQRLNISICDPSKLKRRGRPRKRVDCEQIIEKVFSCSDQGR